MKTLRNELLVTLQAITFSGVDKIADMKNSEYVISNLEKNVFTNSLLCIGDMKLESKRFSHAYLQQTYTIDLFYIYKTNTGYGYLTQDLDTLFDALTGANYGLSDVVNSVITDSGEVVKYNDKIHYQKITLQVMGYENITGTNFDNYSLQPFYFANDTLGYITVVEV